ncbi:hypothetical protein [Sorangium sp. So ce128]|uniref:hypothetical protein n=1 Tax=Sorangium sp. So ce128 TaxID=3133281 RepID=UPI003F628B97
MFSRTSAIELSTWLDSMAQRTPGTAQWIYPSPAKRALYIELAEDLCDDLEPDTMRSLLAHFDGERPHGVCVDVSRNHSAEREAAEFAVSILRQFGGVAIDDEGDRFWTAEEIEAGDTHQGRRFAGVPGAE